MVHMHIIVDHGMDSVDPIDRTHSEEMAYLTISKWHPEQQK